MRQAFAAAVLFAALVAGCVGSAPTPLPPGFPLNPCPMAGSGSVTPRVGYVLVPPGAIAFGYEAWHNETPDSFPCGAQSVRGAKPVISRAAVPSGILPWAATFHRSIPLHVAETERPKTQLFRLDATGDVLIQSGDFGAGPQYGALGNSFEGITPMALGAYRLDIVSASGELLATGRFEIVE